jgi:hypothetical protein
MKRQLLLEERVPFECEIPPNKDKEILKQQLEPEKGEFDTPSEEERYRQHLHESTIHRIDTLRSIRPETEREYYRDQTEQDRRILIAERDYYQAQVNVLQQYIVDYIQISPIPSITLTEDSTISGLIGEDTIDETTPKI